MLFAVVNEMHFNEMIERAAQKENQDCLILSDEEALWAALQEESPDVIFMDLSISSVDMPSLIEKLKQNPSTKAIPIVAFTQSVRADLMQDAKELRADRVLPKAAFREQLTGFIRHYCKK